MRRRNASPSATPSLGGRYDVVICGASSRLGLAIARELTGSGSQRAGARSLPDRRARHLGLRHPDQLAAGTRPAGARAAALRRARRPHPRADGRSSTSLHFSTFNYDEDVRCCSGASATRDFEVATVCGRGAEVEGEITVETDRERGRPHWSSTRSAGGGFWPPGRRLPAPRAPLTRALEVHPPGTSEDLEVWVDRRDAAAGYGWSLPGRR